MPKETMSPRERWQAAIDHRRPDRVPMDYWGTAEATQNLCRHLGCTADEAFDRLHIDRPFTVAGRYVGPALPDNQNVFGVRTRPVSYGAGTYREFVHHPLAAFHSVEEIEANYTWPQPDWWDYRHLSETIRGHEHQPIRGGGSEPFLLYCALRGMEQAYMDLVLNPPLVHYCLDKLFDLAYEDTRRIFEAIPGQVMITYVAEDLGSQESLLFSPTQMKKFLFPRMKRMIDLTHEHGSHVFTHSDGAIRPVIEDLIALGTEVLNPIQWRCAGMEREALKRDFGARLTFHGGMDNQHTVPFGTVDDVRQEVLDNLRILGAGGGYILAPCHNIQSVTPPENIVAIYETGYANGWA
jgi:uroporphyrinogen decarboxylase